MSWTDQNWFACEACSNAFVVDIVITGNPVKCPLCGSPDKVHGPLTITPIPQMGPPYD